MSDKKQDIIPISMVYQPNNRLQNCKLLINRSDNNMVSNFDLVTSSNFVQSNRNLTGHTRLQSVVKVSNNANSQPIVRTIGATRMATVGRMLPSNSTQQPTLIVQSGKPFFTQPQLQQKQQQFQQKLQIQQPQQQIFQPNSQTILIPQSIKSQSNLILQALPLSTTQRINKSFVKRSNSNTTIDLTLNNNNNNSHSIVNNNLNRSCNNLSSLNNNNNHFINKISNSIPNISNNLNNSINNNNNNGGTKFYRVLGGPSSNIKTTSIIKPPNNSMVSKSKSMTIVNPPQQANRSLVQTTTTSTSTPRLILPATNNTSISKHTPPASITYITTTNSTPLGNNNHNQNHRHNAFKTEVMSTSVTETAIPSTPSNNNNLSFSLIQHPSSSRTSKDPSTTPSNNNNILIQNNNILLQNYNNNNEKESPPQQQQPFNLDFVQGYRAKITEQQQKQQNWLTSIESNLRQRKPCNCTKSQCLKLYCECFANGEFCKDCNCCNCANNLEHEDERARAVRNCIERNPHAFHPKIGKGGSNRHHNKGCNCKRSGCLKNYCECYEAKILCSHLCRCVSCRNYEENSDRQKLMQLADVAEARVHQQTAADNKLSMHILGTSSPSKPPGQVINGQRPPYTFVTLDVIEAISSCLIAEADDHQASSESVQERHVLEEFGRCLSQVIEMASKSKAASP